MARSRACRGRGHDADDGLGRLCVRHERARAPHDETALFASAEGHFRRTGPHSGGLAAAARGARGGAVDVGWVVGDAERMLEVESGGTLAGGGAVAALGAGVGIVDTMMLECTISTHLTF